MQQLCFPGFEPEPSACCFTGSRRVPLELRQWLQKEVEAETLRLAQSGVLVFYAGGALGFDTLAEKAVLKLREGNPRIQLCLALPCRDQARGWPPQDIRVYQEILSAADKVVYTGESYEPGCMHRRNRWMADHSSVCVCWAGTKDGGAAYTASYALSRGLEVIDLAGRRLQEGVY